MLTNSGLPFRVNIALFLDSKVLPKYPLGLVLASPSLLLRKVKYSSAALVVKDSSRMKEVT